MIVALRIAQDFIGLSTDSILVSPYLVLIVDEEDGGGAGAGVER